MNMTHSTVVGSDQDKIIAHAKAVCLKKGVKLTRLRQQILQLVWSNHKPVGAYAIMEQLEQNSKREHVAPPTVYRSLDFLLEQGLIHKVHSQNAYIACCSPIHKHGDVLFICNGCGVALEVPNNSIQQAVNLSASQNRFMVQDQIFEIKGLCVDCKKRGSQASHE